MGNPLYMEVLMGKSSIIYIYTDYMDYKGLYMGCMDYIYLVGGAITICKK
jgi:hypothetical protein